MHFHCCAFLGRIASATMLYSQKSILLPNCQSKIVFFFCLGIFRRQGNAKSIFHYLALQFQCDTRRLVVLSDKEAFIGIRNGDSLVLSQLYKMHYPRIASMVKSNSGSEDDARDLFQDAIMVLYTKSKNPDFNLSSSIYTFLYSVSRNLWLKKLRKLKGQGITIREDVELRDESIESEQEELLLEARRQLFRKKFRDLGDGCQDLLKLSMAGKKIPEIVATLNLSSELYARQKKFKCKNQLTKLVQSAPEYHSLMQDA